MILIRTEKFSLYRLFLLYPEKYSKAFIRYHLSKFLFLNYQETCLRLLLHFGVTNSNATILYFLVGRQHSPFFSVCYEDT